MAWLLFSDCLLYLPVAFLCVSSLLRLPSAATGPEAALAVLLLVAPLPACVNPLLYVLFSPPARNQLALLLARRPREGGPEKGEGAGVGWRSKRRGRGRERGRGRGGGNGEDAEKESCDSTQVLVAVGRTKEGEEEEERGRGASPTVFVVPHH